MSWHYTYTPTIWPSLLTLLFLLAMALYSSSRRRVPGVLPFMAGCLFGAAWAAGSVMEYAAIPLATKIFWIKFEAAWQLPAATTITCFVLEYAWPGRWLTRRNLALLSIVPLSVLGLIITNDQHHLMWLNFSLDGTVNATLGPVGWAAIIYSFGLVFLNLGVFVWLFLHSPPHRWPVAIMVSGHIGFRTLFIFEKTNLIQFGLPLDLIGLALLALTYAIALFGFRFFDPIPLARLMAIEQLRDGMLVLDRLGQVVSLNPVAEKIFGTSLKQSHGKRIEELLPELAGQSTLLTGSAGLLKPLEVNVQIGAQTRSYELDFVPLNDFRRLPIGSLLMMHDVTTQKQAQSQLLAQQRALAAVKEREKVARELHDELSQELAFINVQAQSIGDLLASGDTDQAGARLQLLAKIAREAHVDVRGQITKLSLSVQPAEGFLGALRRFLEVFHNMYGIQAELILSQDLANISLEPTVEMELLRIIQEAFTNIRKHASASHVGVSLAAEPESLTVCIEDDGVGFDPAETLSGRRYGMHIMTERAMEIGGRIEVQSIPGQGTRVVVTVPRRVEMRGENENLVGR